MYPKIYKHTLLLFTHNKCLSALFNLMLELEPVLGKVILLPHPILLLYMYSNYYVCISVNKICLNQWLPKFNPQSICANLHGGGNGQWPSPCDKVREGMIMLQFQPIFKDWPLFILELVCVQIW